MPLLKMISAACRQSFQQMLLTFVLHLFYI
jgi:hypothetical protein